MWVRDGAAYFFGPIFIYPEETEHEPTKMFYKKEVFLSNLEESCPMTCITGILYCSVSDCFTKLQLFSETIRSLPKNIFILVENAVPYLACLLLREVRSVFI